MSYTKKIWKTGDTIKAADLNNIEEGTSANASAIEKIEQSLKTYVGADVPRKAAATITPSKTNQTIAANQYLTGAQTIKGDGNLSAGNIKKGVSIFGVAGTYAASSGGSGTNTSDATAEANDIVSGKTAYVASGKVTGTLSTSTTLRSNAATITETTNTSTLGQTSKDINVETSKITGISGKKVVDSDSTKIVLTTSASNFGNATAADVATGKTFTSAAGLKVKGTKAASSGLDTSDATAAASDILSGKTAYVNGSKVTGTISKKTSATITPSTTDQTISSGQYLSGAQTIKGDANLVAANIKRGVSIFGVTGTLENSGSGGAVSKSGAVTGNGGEQTIDTGLSSILAFLITPTTAPSATGLYYLVYMQNILRATGVSKSQYFNSYYVTTDSSTASISGGRVTLKSSNSYYKPINNTTYTWYAVGEA